MSGLPHTNPPSDWVLDAARSFKGALARATRTLVDSGHVRRSWAFGDYFYLVMDAPNCRCVVAPDLKLDNDMNVARTTPPLGALLDT